MAAPTFGQVAATQLTASGTGQTLTTTAGYRKSIYLRHSNGTGTVTAQGTAAVQVKPSGGTFTTMQTFTFSSVAAFLDHRILTLPDDSVAVQVVYTQPSGVSSPTLDYEIGTVN